MPRNSRQRERRFEHGETAPDAKARATAEGEIRELRQRRAV
jgi:hypothetical protein